MAGYIVGHGSIWERQRDKEGHTTYRKSWLVGLPDGEWGTFMAESAPGIPFYREGYAIYDENGGLIEADGTAFCYDKSSRLVGPGNVWEVECIYSSKESAQFENPLDWSGKPHWAYAFWEKDWLHDADGQKILNAAGDPWEGLRTTDARMVLTYTVNVPQYSFSTGTFNQYPLTLNSGAWFGFPAKTVQLLDWTFDPNTIRLHNSGVPITLKYWATKMVFHFKEAGWEVRKILEAGFRYKDPADGKLKAILTDDGLAVTTPYLLKANGDKLPVGDPPVYAEKKEFKTKDFSILPVYSLTTW